MENLENSEWVEYQLVSRLAGNQPQFLGLLENLIGFGRFDAQALDQAIDDGFPQHGCSVGREKVGKLVPDVAQFLPVLDVELQLSVGCRIDGNGFLVELENDIVTLAMTAHAVAGDEQGAMLLDVEDVTGLLVQHGADVAFHRLVLLALVLVHDHDDAAIVITGYRGQLVDHHLALVHVIVVVDQVGDAVHDDQVGVIALDGADDEFIARNRLALVLAVDAGLAQAEHVKVLVALLGRQLLDGLADACRVAHGLLGVKEQDLTLLDEVSTVMESR